MSKKIILVVVCLVVAGTALLGGKYLSDVGKYKKIVSDIEIQTPDISKVNDGSYNGVFDAIIVSADVDVHIKDNMIDAIVINEHKNERGEKAEVITDEVLASQSLNVDTVSGATNSSKVILKAIENALENGSK